MAAVVVSHPDSDAIVKAFKQVVLCGIVLEIKGAYDRGSNRSALILLYCGMDVMAHFMMSDGKLKAGKADFISWVDKYISFRTDARKAVVPIQGLELYAARCAVIHSYGTEADLHRDGKARRQIGYVTESPIGLAEVFHDEKVESLILISIEGMIRAFTAAVLASLSEARADPALLYRVGKRLHFMMHEFDLTLGRR